MLFSASLVLLALELTNIPPAVMKMTFLNVYKRVFAHVCMLHIKLMPGGCVCIPCAVAEAIMARAGLERVLPAAGVYLRG